MAGCEIEIPAGKSPVAVADASFRKFSCFSPDFYVFYPAPKQAANQCTRFL